MCYIQSFSQEFKSVPLQACLYLALRDVCKFSEILLVERGRVRPDVTNKKPRTPTLTHHLQLQICKVVRPLRVYKQINFSRSFFQFLLILGGQSHDALNITNAKNAIHIVWWICFKNKILFNSLNYSFNCLPLNAVRSFLNKSHVYMV